MKKYKEKMMRVRPNVGIRRQICDSGLYQYEVAQQIGINEITLIRWLREPLDAEKAARIQKAIDDLTNQNRKEDFNGR